MPLRKKDKQELTSGELGKEFFGDGSTAAPGQSQEEDSATLFQAIAGSKETAAKDDSYSLFGSSKSQADVGPDYSKRSWFQLGGSDNPEVNPYAAEQDKRYGLNANAKKLIKLGVLAVVFFILFVILPSSTYNIDYALTPNAMLTCIKENVAAFFGLVSGQGDAEAISYKICMYALVLFAGAALAITGAVYQGALKNALVSPTTLGVSAGGTMGAVIFIVLAPISLLNPVSSDSGIVAISEYTKYYNSLSLGEYIIAHSGQALASVAGCLIAVGLVLLVSHLVGRGTSSGFALIICGQVVAAVASSVVEVIRYYVVETDPSGVRSELIQARQIGEVSFMTSPLDVLLVAVPVIIGIVIILMLRRKLNLLAFNDEEARSMGIATERLRWSMVGVCTLITAVVIAFCGNIAFVGFAIPLIARRYVGPDFNYLIPASALMGAAFLVFMQWFSSVDIFAMFGITFEGSVSLYTSIIGAVMFAVITIGQRRSGRNADWL